MMKYTLRRESDSAGDSGGMSMGIWRAEDGQMHFEHDARPRVGMQMRVGSSYARSYSVQDYWTTTDITEIIEEADDYVRFKTISNSTYTWTCMP